MRNYLYKGNPERISMLFKFYRTAINGIITYIVVLGNKETAGLYAEMADEVVVANHVDDAGYAIENIMKRWKKDANFLYY